MRSYLLSTAAQNSWWDVFTLRPNPRGPWELMCVHITKDVQFTESLSKFLSAQGALRHVLARACVWQRALEKEHKWVATANIEHGHHCTGLCQHASLGSGMSGLTELHAGMGLCVVSILKWGSSRWQRNGSAHVYHHAL